MTETAANNAGSSNSGHDDKDVRIAKLEKMNQTLVRHNQRAEQQIKHLEDCLALVQRHGSDILARMGKDGKIRSCTDALLERVGVKPEQWVGRWLADLVPKEERGRLRGFLQEAGRSGHVEQCTLHVWNSEQKLITLQCFFQTIPHIQNQTPEILMLGRPMAVAPAAAPPPAAEFGARLAHELSQPLTTIGTTSRVCARQLRELLGVDHEITQAIEQMARESERAAELIVRLRQLSHGGPAHRSSVDINQMLRDTLEALQGAVAEADVEVVWELTRDLPSVQADRIQLGQAFHNLIRNALEALALVKSGQRRLTLGTRLAERSLEISCADTGPGVSREMREKLFMPYQSSKPKGLGMGLALSRSIVEAHQGGLLFQENTPRGARFLITLPVYT